MPVGHYPNAMAADAVRYLLSTVADRLGGTAFLNTDGLRARCNMDGRLVPPTVLSAVGGRP